MSFMSCALRLGFHRLTVGLLLAGATLAGAAGATASKEKVEPARLLASGDNCRTNARPAEALLWYRQAAQAGSIEAAYRAGVLLLDGEKSNLPAQSVPPDPAEGVRWLFRAATNQYPPACREMSRVYRDGVGVKTNLVQAYAWVRLFCELEPGPGAMEMDRLALKLEAQQIQAAQQLAWQFKNHQWPPAPCKKIVEGDPRLSLNGLTLGGKKPLAVINRKTLAEGETAEFATPKGSIVVTCVDIRDQSVVVDIAGENEARLLSFR
jgi:TPR repeat protein